MNFGIRGLNGAVKNKTLRLHHWTGIIGTSVSGTFLYLIGLLNLVVLASIVKVAGRCGRANTTTPSSSASSTTGG